MEAAKVALRLFLILDSMKFCILMNVFFRVRRDDWS